jgi:methionyl aminopeptidase
MITIKSEREIELMRISGRLAAQTLDMIGAHVKPGVSTEELNTLCHDFIVSHGAYPAPLNYKGFPKSICTSVNAVVCHGIPNKKEILQDGDIVNIDVTALLNGFHGDTNRTYYVGTPSDEARQLVEFTEQVLHEAIAIVKPGIRIGDIGHLIQTRAEAKGYGVVREFTGHGIGRQFHEPPSIPHYGQAGRGPKLRKGMTFTIEPMINLGGAALHVLSDGWTAVTNDGKLSAQFEHTLAVTDTGYEILTLSH